MEIVIRIPGEPVAQGRPRAFHRSGMKGVRMYDPAKSRNWKATAQQLYIDALRSAGVALPGFAGPLELDVLAVFTCPKSHWRKRAPLPRRPKMSTPDGSNILKCVEDAGNGVLWIDDAQLAVATVRRVIGAQGEAPYVEVRVREIVDGAA